MPRDPEGTSDRSACDDVAETAFAMEHVLSLMRTMRHRFRISDPQALEAILRCTLVVAEERGMEESEQELLRVMITAHRAHCG